MAVFWISSASWDSKVGYNHLIFVINFQLVTQCALHIVSTQKSLIQRWPLGELGQQVSRFRYVYIWIGTSKLVFWFFMAFYLSLSHLSRHKNTSKA